MVSSMHMSGHSFCSQLSISVFETKQHWSLEFCITGSCLRLSYMSSVDGSNNKLQGFTDWDWAENLHDRSSTSGYIFRLGNRPISWRSRKQKTKALLNTEAEYMALSDAGRKAMRLRQLLQGICFIDNLPTIIHYDNTDSAALANNPIHHSRSKRIDLRYHFIQQLIKKM